MRFIAAIVTFVIAFLLIGFGIAQRTVFAAPDNVTASLQLKDDATVTVIDSKTLHSNAGRQSVAISGAPNVFAAYGRTEDVLAWVGKAGYNKIGFNPDTSKLTNKFVKGKETVVPDPHGSDLWLDEFSRAKSLNFTVNVPNDISIIVVSDGTKPAPSNVSIRWPLDNSTPWSGPLILGGIVVLIISLGLYLWALVHSRRKRGPRRKSPKMPKVPRQRGYRPRKAQSSPPAPGGRRSAKRSMVAAGPIVLVGLLALSGCSAQAAPKAATGGSSAAPTPTASASVATPKDQKPPAVSVPQLRVIVDRIAAVTTKADATLDPELAKTRFDGAALALRTANYAIRKVDNTVAAPAAILTQKIGVTLPQQTDTWPRAVFTVTQNPAVKTAPPVALMLVQKSARENYKVAYATTLEPNAKVRALAPANVGAPPVSPDSKFLVMAPDKVAMAYGDILAKGPESASAKDFDTSKDTFIGPYGLDSRKKLQAALPATAALDFANTDGPDASIALGSNDSGAIVAVSLNETVTVKPVEAGAAINPEGQVKSLSGLTGTTKGTQSIYGDQLLFYIPAAGSKAKVILLGFATGLVSAKELP